MFKNTLLLSLLLFYLSQTTFSQQALTTPSATMPADGVTTMRQIIKTSKYGNDPTGQGRRLTKTEYITRFDHGIDKGLTATFLTSFSDSRIRRPSKEHDQKTYFDRAHVMLKYRFFQNDFGPFNTFRAVAMTGTNLPIGDPKTNDDRWCPMIGLATLWINGRHGVDTAFRAMFPTSKGDENPITKTDGNSTMLHFNSAYLYRITPTEYSMNTISSSYITLESSLIYQDNGDQELFITPGYLWEGKESAIEVGLKLPIASEIDHRLEEKWSLLAGFRLIF